MKTKSNLNLFKIETSKELGTPVIFVHFKEIGGDVLSNGQTLKIGLREKKNGFKLFVNLKI